LLGPAQRKHRHHISYSLLAVFSPKIARRGKVIRLAKVKIE